MSEATEVQALRELLEAKLETLRAEFNAHKVLDDNRHANTTINTAAALASAEKAIAKQEVATEKRLEGLNEIRELALDNSKAFYPKNEAESRFSATQEKIETLDKTITEKMTAHVLSLTGRIDTMTHQLDDARSQKVGVHWGWSAAIGAAGFISLVIGLMLYVKSFKP